MSKRNANASRHATPSPVLPLPPPPDDDTSAPGPIAALRAAASDLMSRIGLAARAGLTYLGKRDLFAALGYKRDLDISDYRARFLRGDIGSRIIEVYPKATWRGGGELVENDDPKVTTRFEAAWDALNTRLHIWSALGKTDILAGIGNYAALLLGAPGDLATELPRAKGPDSLLYVQPFGQYDVEIDTFETSTDSPRFGLPTMYKIKRLDPTSVGRQVTSGQTRKVHWSRVLHVACDTLDDNVNGTPRLERVWNRLDDLDKICGGGAEAFWLRAHQGFQFDLDPEVDLSAAEITKLQDEVDEYLNNMRRAVRTRGVTMKALGSNVADFSRPLDACLTIISASTGIPKRILMGSERGELASTQDKTNWDERVTDRRTEWAGPHAVRPLVDRLIEYGYLPAPKVTDKNPIGYEVRWPQIQNLTESERADIAVKYAQVNKDCGETVVFPDEIRDRALGLPSREEVDPTFDPTLEEDEPAGEGAVADPADPASTDDDPADDEGDEGDE